MIRRLFNRAERQQNKWERRASRMSTQDLLDWSEVALNGIGRSLSAYRRSGDETALLEAQEGAEALLAVVGTVVSRAT